MLRFDIFVSESRGTRFPATLHMLSPFDPENLRIQGTYSPENITQGDLQLLKTKLR
jgi:hypothetical protein